MQIENVKNYDASFMWGVAEAVKKLRPGSKFTLYDRDFIEWDDPNGLPPPKWEEIQTILDEDEKIYNSLKYSRDRASEYPNPLDQLDELWHFVNTGGVIDTNSEWYQNIKRIKEKYPKP